MNLSEKIVELVPEIPNRYQYTITLADVLRAMPPSVYLKTLGEQTRLIVDEPSREHGPIYWDCTVPDLDGQSPECKAFLSKILL